MGLDPNSAYRLQGTPFKLVLPEGVLEYTFEKGPDDESYAASGSEGTMLPARHGTDRVAVKLFDEATADRELRALVLQSLDLRSLLPVFEAAPNIVCRVSLRVPGNTNVPEREHHGLLAVVGKYIDGVGLERLLSGYVSSSDRVRIAGELSQAVEVLEAGGLTHSDLCCRNVRVMRRARDGVYEPRIIDWDSFQLSGAPRAEKTITSNGYRHRSPEPSDRLSLAVILFRIIVAGPDSVEPELWQDTIDDGEPIMSEYAHVWPEGWALLSRAIAVDSPKDAPSPGEWLDALWDYASSPMRHSSNHFVEYACDGQPRGWYYLDGPRDDFGRIDSRLADVEYVYSVDGGLYLRGSPTSLRAGVTPNAEVLLKPNDGESIRVGRWTLTFARGPRV